MLKRQNRWMKIEKEDNKYKMKKWKKKSLIQQHCFKDALKRPNEPQKTKIQARWRMKMKWKLKVNNQNNHIHSNNHSHSRTHNRTHSRSQESKHKWIKFQQDNNDKNSWQNKLKTPERLRERNNNERNLKNLQLKLIWRITFTNAGQWKRTGGANDFASINIPKLQNSSSKAFLREYSVWGQHTKRHLQAHQYLQWMHRRISNTGYAISRSM